MNENPLDARNIPPVNYASLEWRMYHALHLAYMMISSGIQPPPEEKKQKLLDLLASLGQEYEERKFNSYRERN